MELNYQCIYNRISGWFS